MRSTERGRLSDPTRAGVRFPRTPLVDNRSYPELKPSEAASIFWSYAKSRGDCWIWTYSVGSRGYGFAPAKVAHFFGKRTMTAHRAAYRLTYGDIPAGAMVMHACDNPICVAPLHLFLGGHRENMADMKAKGRAGGGRTGGPWLKLTPTRMAELVERYRKGEAIRSLARAFELAPNGVRLALRRVATTDSLGK